MTRAEELAKAIVESFASKPEQLPSGPDHATWDTHGVGSITAEELAQKIVGALIAYGWEVRRMAAQEVPTNWCDPLLTGKNKVINDPPYTGLDIEALLRAVKNNVETMDLP